MLDEHTLPLLKAGKNLLAFSAGVDSSALFFLLQGAGIAFDIAHVNYHTREQSAEEEAHARALAATHGKTCHVLQAPAIRSNFEAQARRIRYAFFESLMTDYDTLLTAHQLDDRFEWLIMQLGKGAGLPELLGMSPVTRCEGYTMIRPLLRVSKSQLRQWLESNKLPYFEDESNHDPRYARNRIRAAFAAPFLETHREGVLRSFDYLSRDAAVLAADEPPAIEAEILMLKTPLQRQELMRRADHWLKRKGYLLRQGEKARIYDEDELVLGRRYALSIGTEWTLLTPLSTARMPKPFKELCRRLGVGVRVRPYLSENPAIFEAVRSQLHAWRPEA